MLVGGVHQFNLVARLGVITEGDTVFTPEVGEGRSLPKPACWATELRISGDIDGFNSLE